MTDQHCVACGCDIYDTEAHIAHHEHLNVVIAAVNRQSESIKMLGEALMNLSEGVIELDKSQRKAFKQHERHHHG